MAKIFFIREVDELMTNMIKDMAAAAVLSEPIEECGKVMEAVTVLCHYKHFAKLVIDAMREKEADEDRLIEEIRRGPKTDGTDS